MTGADVSIRLFVEEDGSTGSFGICTAGSCRGESAGEVFGSSLKTGGAGEDAFRSVFSFSLKMGIANGEGEAEGEEDFGPSDFSFGSFTLNGGSASGEGEEEASMKSVCCGDEEGAGKALPVALREGGRAEEEEEFSKKKQCYF